MTTAYITVKEHLGDCFKQQRYDGGYHDSTGFRTPESEEASESFRRISVGKIQWPQVHGDFKDAAKRAMFDPYPNWAELYECCRLVVKANIELNKNWNELTAAKIMGDVMTVMRQKYGLNVPKFWLPIMRTLRDGL
ncbi:MAG TPA: hypothetical protein VNO32_43290 [Candidatus Acidoferrum sp.]|nr:hypothetical protein [Candidatus Acidoferrum sp.]